LKEQKQGKLVTANGLQIFMLCQLPERVFRDIAQHNGTSPRFFTIQIFPLANTISATAVLNRFHGSHCTPTKSYANI